MVYFDFGLKFKYLIQVFSKKIVMCMCARTYFIFHVNIYAYWEINNQIVQILHNFFKYRHENTYIRWGTNTQLLNFFRIYFMNRGLLHSHHAHITILFFSIF